MAQVSQVTDSRSSRENWDVIADLFAAHSSARAVQTRFQLARAGRRGARSVQKRFQLARAERRGDRAFQTSSQHARTGHRGSPSRPLPTSPPPLPTSPPPLPEPEFMCAPILINMVKDSMEGQQHPPLGAGFTVPPPQQPPNQMDANFYECLRAGKSDALQKMLEMNVENSKLGQRSPQNNTPLHFVARRHGLDQLVNIILAKRPDLLTQQNMNKDLPLHAAAGAGNLAAVESIITFARGLEVGPGRVDQVCKTKNRDGETALHVAVRHKHTLVACSLITACSKAVMCLDRRGESPLFVAAELGDLELVKSMTQLSTIGIPGPNNPMEKSVVLAAIYGGNPGVLKAILSKPRFESLINSPILTMSQGTIYPLSVAALKGNIEMVQYLVKSFPDCINQENPGGTFPIHIAAAAGQKLVIQEFLRVQPDSRELLTRKGQNILHIAASHGKDDVVSYILSKPDFDELISARDQFGKTPLHCAVAAKYPKVVNALTWEKRVRLDLVDNHGQTAMDLALQIDTPMPSLKQQLTWLALRYAGAPKRNFRQAPNNNSLEKATVDDYKARVGTLSVVATLVTTMSFAAGFTVPGGNSESDTNLGMPNFLDRRIFQLFVISNSIALYTAVLDVLVLIFAILGDINLIEVSLKVAIPLLATSLATMSISFMSAAYLVVSNLWWLGIVVWVLGSAYLAAVIALLVMLFPPLSAKNRFTRYLAYLPFMAILYICENKNVHNQTLPEKPTRPPEKPPSFRPVS